LLPGLARKCPPTTGLEEGRGAIGTSEEEECSDTIDSRGAASASALKLTGLAVDPADTLD